MKIEPYIWKAFWIRRALGEEQEKPVPAVGVTPGHVELPENLWWRIERRLDEEQARQSSGLVLRRRYRRRWSMAAAAALVLILLVSLSLMFRVTNGGNGQPAGVQVQNRDVVIRYVKVDDRPARAVYLQPGKLKDRVIVWVKKQRGCCQRKHLRDFFTRNDRLGGPSGWRSHVSDESKDLVPADHFIGHHDGFLGIVGTVFNYQADFAAMDAPGLIDFPGSHFQSQLYLHAPAGNGPAQILV